MTEHADPWAYTVLIPAYNAARWIADAVASATSQDPAPVEVIVVDDGSVDDTASIAEAIEGVRVVRRSNGGEAAARNTALRAATTRWVSFLDADDRFLPYRHRWVIDHLIAHPDLDLVAGDALIEVDGAIIGTLFAQPHAHFALDDQRRAILEGNFLLSHVMGDRHRLLALGGFDERLTHACDWDMWIRYVLAGGTIGRVDRPLSLYRRHDASMTADRSRVTAGDIAVWAKALTLPQLTSDERGRIAAHLAEARPRLERDHMKAALVRGDKDVRRCAVQIARSSNQPAVARAKAATVAVAPSVHRALLRLRRWAP